MPQWVTEVGVPCFRPHVRKDKDGQTEYEVTAADLAEIATNSNKFTVELHGAKPPITEGHRNFAKDAKEAEQPLVLGYEDNFRPGTLPDGTPCILCDRHYMAQYADRAKRHPYASVEYIHALKAIVGLAKLTRPPALNLGGVFYPGTSHPVYVYQMDDQKPPEAAPQAPQTPELTPEEIQGCEKVYAYLTKKYAWMATCAKKYEAGDAGPGQPSANNTKPPGDGEDDDKDKDKPDMSQANTELVKKYEATQDQLAKLIAEREAEKVDRILDGLEKVERYQFDREAEKARMLRLTEAERLKRAEEIRKYHHQTAAQQISVYSGNVEGPKGQTTGDEMKRAVSYASKHGVSYDEGLAAVRAGK